MSEFFWCGVSVGFVVGFFVGELMIRGLAWLVVWVVFKVTGKRLRQWVSDGKEVA